MFSFCSSKGKGEVEEQELKWFVPTVRHVKDELTVGQVLEPKKSNILKRRSKAYIIIITTTYFPVPPVKPRGTLVCQACDICYPRDIYAAMPMYVVSVFCPCKWVGSQFTSVMIEHAYLFCQCCPEQNG